MVILLLTLVLAACQDPHSITPRAPWDDTPAFWIWNQTTPWTADSAGHNYLQVAEFTGTSHRELQSPPAAPSTTPVVRLPAGRATLEDPEFTKRFLGWARKFLAKSAHSRLQVDYDCSTSTLAHYAEFLVNLRKQLQLDEVSITALASWIDAPDFQELCQAVDEITPMFYDLEADLPALIRDNTPLPLIDNTTVFWIQKWQTCPVTWRAGCPNFQRLTLFESSGALIGHFQHWSPSHLSHIPGIQALPQKRPDSQTYRITRETHYEGVTMKPGQLLLWRAPAEDDTLRALAAAQTAGAAGVIWFAHPDSTPVAWHSVSHLTVLQKGEKPLPALRHTFLPDGSVTLINQGPGDLPFRPGEAPCQLILEANSPDTFAGVDAGSFSGIAAPGSSLVRPGLIRALILSLPGLRSGKSLASGPGLIKEPTSASPSVRIHPQQPSS